MRNIRISRLLFVSAMFIGVAQAAPGDTDTTFGTSGLLRSAVGGPSMFDPKVVVQPDGRILVSGAQFNGKDNDFVVLRYLSSGVPDTSFGTGGMTQIDFYGGNDIAKAIILQADGTILLGGEAAKKSGGYGMHAVARLTSSGALDTSFGTGGKVLTDFGITSHIHGLALQADGKIIAVGETYSSTDGGAAAISRYNADGSVDTTFGTNGKVTPFSNTTNSHVGIALSNGKILIAGYNIPSGSSQFQCFVARMSSAGVLDTGFGTAGIVQIPVGAGVSHCNAMALQPDGKILVAGGAQMNATSNYDFVLIRLAADGQPDPSFGATSTTGITTTAFSTTGIPTNEEAADAVLQPDGKVILAGYSNKKFALARYLSNGGIDSSFGSGGKVTLPISGQDDWVKGLALQPDGRIIASGFSFDGANYLISMARLQNDSGGALPDYERAFNWAEGVLPQYFPPGPATQLYGGYFARVYSNGYAVGSKDSRLYAYGAVLGGLVDLGLVSSWTTRVFDAGY